MKPLNTPIPMNAPRQAPSAAAISDLVLLLLIATTNTLYILVPDLS